MTDRDRLIDLIVSANIFLFGSDKPYAEVYADHLIANGVTVNEWISVEEKLPDTDDNVLVICNGEYKNIRFINAYDLAAYDSDEDEWILDSYPEAVVTVTHWMPLPKPPKEVDNGKID